MKDPLLDQGAKARAVCGHRANSGQQETGRGQFSHIAPSLTQEAPFPLLCPHAMA